MVVLITLLLWLCLSSGLTAGSFPPPVGEEGSTAIAADDGRITAWASGVVSVQIGENVDEIWKDADKALGPASIDVGDVVSLGDGGVIVLRFEEPLSNGPGWDLVVFENALNDFFLELAMISVSSDGIHWVQFPFQSEMTTPVEAYGFADTTEISGLAGKYRVGYGTPFDLNSLRALPESDFLDFSNIPFVRIEDVTGNGSITDSKGNPVYDPYPTFGSGGFDLQAVGRMVDIVPEVRDVRVAGSDIALDWFAPAGVSVFLESSEDIATWKVELDLVGTGNTETVMVPIAGDLYLRLRK